MNFDIIKHHIGNSEINSISARELYNVLDKLDSKIRTYFPIILNYKGKV